MKAVIYRANRPTNLRLDPQTDKNSKQIRYGEMISVYAILEGAYGKIAVIRKGNISKQTFYIQLEDYEVLTPSGDWKPAR